MKKYKHISSRSSLILLTSVVLPFMLTASANSTPITLVGNDNLVWEVGRGIHKEIGRGVNRETITTDKLSEIGTSATATGDLTTLSMAVADAIKNAAISPTKQNEMTLEQAKAQLQQAIAQEQGYTLPLIKFEDSVELNGQSDANNQSLNVAAGALTFDIEKNNSVTISNNNGKQAIVVENRGLFAQTGEGKLNIFNIQTNSSEVGFGGAVQNRGIIVFGDNVTFINNQSHNSGNKDGYAGIGGAVMTDGVFKIGHHATFENNQSDGHGGAVYGGSRNGLGENVIGDDATFINNRSLNQWGGAIYGQDSSWIVGANANFTGNSAALGGGAISMHNSHITIGSGARFEDNTANEGGAIHFNDSVFKIGHHATFENNQSDGHGGAVYGQSKNGLGENVIGDDATFTNNRSLNQWGGAIYGLDSSWIVGANANFTGNSAALGGGAIRMHTSHITIGSGARFEDNTANEGGALHFTSSDVNLITNKLSRATQFFGNTDHSGSNALFMFSGNLNIVGDGELDMLDPMMGDNGNILQSGGSWYLAGNNTFSNNVNFKVSQGGTLYLYGEGEQSKTGAATDGAIVKATTGGITIGGKGGSFKLDGNATLSVGGMGSAIKVANGEITIGDHANLDFNLAAAQLNGNAMLNLTGKTITAGPSLNINLTSMAGENGLYTLLHFNQNGLLDGKNIRLSAGGQSIGDVDFLQGTEGFVGKNDYRVEIGNLTWNSNAVDKSDMITTLAHGDFTLNEGNFTLDQALHDRPSGAYLRSWDGKSLTKKGNGTLILNGANGYTGITAIEAGTLMVGGSSEHNDAHIIGNVIAHSGGALDGFGSIYGNVDMESGSKLSAGKFGEIGTLTLGGLRLHDGSELVFEADPNGAGDLITVNSGRGGTGVAQIDNGARLIINGVGSGIWGDYNEYAVIKTDGGVNGRFGQVVNNLAFLDYSVIYEPNEVDLRFIRNDIDFGDVDGTYNERSTGHGIDGLPTDNPIVQNVVKLAKDNVLPAFDNLSGEIYGSTRTALINNSRYLRDAMNRRMLTDGRLPTADPVWISSWGHGGRIAGDGNAVGIDNSGWGVALGLDGEAADNVFGGLVLGYENSDIKNGGARNSHSDVDSYHVGAYGATELNGIKFRAGLAYSYLDLSTDRHLWVAGLEGKAKSNYNGYQLQFFGEASKDLSLSKSATLSPYVNLAQVWLHLDDADESGSKADLSVEGDNDSVLLTTVGIRGNYKLPTSTASSLYADLGWVHAYGDTVATTSNRFGRTGKPFSIKGVGLGEDVALIGTGIESTLSATSSIILGYQGEIGSGESDHSANLQWKVKF